MAQVPAIQVQFMAVVSIDGEVSDIVSSADVAVTGDMLGCIKSFANVTRVDMRIGYDRDSFYNPVS